MKPTPKQCRMSLTVDSAKTAGICWCWSLEAATAATVYHCTPLQQSHSKKHYIINYLYHTHTCLTALFLGLPRWASTRKVKPMWILLKQETVSGSGISWTICKSAPRSRQITTPAPHHSVFLQAGCPSCHPTNSVKALKAITIYSGLNKNNRKVHHGEWEKQSQDNVHVKLSK